MGRIYSASFSGSAQTAQVDFFELQNPADTVLAIHEIVITQTTEVQDAEEEMLLVNLNRNSGATTSGSGGSTATPRPHHTGDAASGVTVETNNTTKISGGTQVTIRAESFNVRVGYYYHPAPEDRIYISPDEEFTVELATTPADSVTFNGLIVFEELGG